MIPNIFHFCFIIEKDSNSMPFSLVHYLAIKSANDVNKPEIINFYYNHEPKGEWWERSKELVNLIKVEPPE